VGDKVTLADVLLIGGEETRVGAPTLANVAVLAEVVSQGAMPRSESSSTRSASTTVAPRAPTVAHGPQIEAIQI
jgi:ribosomal protein L21